MLRRTLVVGIAGLVAYGVFGFILMLGTVATPATSGGDSALQDSLSRELSKTVPGVLVKVADGAATLSGSVPTYQDKMTAGQAAADYDGVFRVANSITVAGPAIDDRLLAQTLEAKLAGSPGKQGNIYDTFWVQVRDGAATLTGYAHDVPARDNALAIAGAERGVKEVVDQIELLPVSPTDDRIRTQAARRIAKAMNSVRRRPDDPASAIRIIVRDGNVILDGSVPSRLDRTLAERAVANTPGVFSVTSSLRVDREG